MKHRTSFDGLIDWLKKNKDRIEVGDLDYYGILKKVLELREDEAKQITLDEGELACREMFGSKKMYYCKSHLPTDKKIGRLVYTTN